MQGPEAGGAGASVGIAGDRPVGAAGAHLELGLDRGHDVAVDVGLGLAVLLGVAAGGVVRGIADLVRDDGDRGQAPVLRRVGVEGVGDVLHVRGARLPHQYDDHRQRWGILDQGCGRQVDPGRAGLEAGGGVGDVEGSAAADRRQVGRWLPGLPKRLSGGG